MMNKITKKVYGNSGNLDLIKLIDFRNGIILDVGCGNGGNSRIIKKIFPEAIIHGITISPEEEKIVSTFIDKCWICDIELDLPEDLVENEYNLIIFSHVLEHTRYPGEVLDRFLPLLSPHGEILIAVPNFANYSIRIKVLMGNFNYESSGILDYTHFRFFTYKNAESLLFSNLDNLKITKKPSGAFPLSIFGILIPKKLKDWMNNIFLKLFPNIFSWQILIKARKTFD